LQEVFEEELPKTGQLLKVDIDLLQLHEVAHLDRLTFVRHVVHLWDLDKD